jgi:hypothetical protein
MSIVVIVWPLGSKTRQTSRIRRNSENWVVLGHTPKLPKIVDRRNGCSGIIYIILIGGFKGLNSKVSPMDPQVTFALFGGKETEAVPGRSGAVCLKTNWRRVGKSWENHGKTTVE